MTCFQVEPGFLSLLRHYIQGCHRGAEKACAAAMVEDALLAMRLVASLETRAQLQAAGFVLRAARAQFPQQKRAAVEKAHKQAALAQRRGGGALRCASRPP